MSKTREVQQLCHEINNSLQAVCGWYELEDIRAAKEALYKLEEQVDKLYDTIELADAERLRARGADA